MALMSHLLANSHKKKLSLLFKALKPEAICKNSTLGAVWAVICCKDRRHKAAAQVKASRV